MDQSERIVLDSIQEAEAKSELLTRWLCRASEWQSHIESNAITSDV